MRILMKGIKGMISTSEIDYIFRDTQAGVGCQNTSKVCRCGGIAAVLIVLHIRPRLI